MIVVKFVDSRVTSAQSYSQVVAKMAPGLIRRQKGDRVHIYYEGTSLLTFLLTYTSVPSSM